MSITIAPLTTTVMGAVEDRYTGAASGANNAVARIAGLLAVAVPGICVAYAFNISFLGHLNALHLSPGVYEALSSQRGRLVGIVIPDSVQGATRLAVRQAIGESFLAGFRLAMCIAAGLAFASALCSVFFVSSPAKYPEHSGEHHIGDNACTLTYVHQRIKKKTERDRVTPATAIEKE